MKPFVFASILFGFASLCLSPPVQAQTDAEVEVTLDTTLQEKGRQQLKRLLREYDLDPWIFTQKVRIKSYATPHSHPILQLSTEFVNDDEKALSTFLHEQAHWFAAADEHDVAREKTEEELRQMYPGAPDDAHSPYLHLIINWLELDAMTQLMGEEKARKVLSSWDHYEWMYERVLQDTKEIGAVLAKHELIITPGDGLVVGTSEN